MSGFALTFDEIEALQRLSDVIWNYLGTRDPDAVAQWISDARREIAELRAAEDDEPWKRA